MTVYDWAIVAVALVFVIRGWRRGLVGEAIDLALILLGSVLERFFRKYVTINSFTETVLVSQQRGEIARWRPESGLGRMI